MAVPRVFFTATFMKNDAILIAGGVTDPTVAGHSLSQVEVYAPNANRDFPGPPLAVGRAGHTATLLASGKVLIAGGYQALGTAALSSIEIYNPGLASSSAGTWSSGPQMKHARSGHAAVLLADGRVLVTGGSSIAAIGQSPHGAVPATLPAEIYDPVSDTWVDAAMPALDRPANPRATLLKDGRVLVVGGEQIWSSPDENTERAEIYDPRTNIWSFATPEVRIGAREYQTATVLANGQILYAGGSRDLQPTGNVTLYDPATNAWTQVANMTENRCGQGAELLPSGNVIVVAGGCGYEAPTATAEQYVPSVNRWYPVSSMDSPRGFVVTVNLGNGIVFVFGGLQPGGTSPNVSVYYSAS